MLPPQTTEISYNMLITGPIDLIFSADLPETPTCLETAMKGSVVTAGDDAIYISTPAKFYDRDCV